MKQMVYKDKFFVSGKPAEVLAQLKALSSRFKTVKEFLEYTAGKL